MYMNLQLKMLKRVDAQPSSIRPFRAHKSPMIGPPPPIKVKNLPVS